MIVVTLKKFFNMGLLSTLVLATLFQSTLHAQSNNPTNGLGLEISPPIIELTLDPGATFTGTIKLRDIIKSDLIVTPRVDDFNAKDETGDPGIVFNADGQTRYSLRTWVDPIPSLRMIPQEIRDIPIRITVPKNAEPGGHYGVIRFQADPANAPGQGVAIGASIGTLVLLRVSGPVKESMSIEQFAVGQGGHFRQFFEKGPFTFSERFKNNGTIHEKPTGYIDVFGMGGKRLATIPVNNNPVKNVLPDSVRRFDQDYGNSKDDQKLWFGRYRADLSLIYGPNNMPLKSTIYFWVIPYKLVVIVLLLLVALIALYNYKRKARSRKK